jgi:hypothetical protein
VAFDVRKSPRNGEPMKHTKPNKYRSALEILHQGKDVLLDTLADDIIHQGSNLIEGGFLFNEFLEVQGSRLHFLALMVCQLEEAAHAKEEKASVEVEEFQAEPKTPQRRSRPKTKKLP